MKRKNKIKSTVNNLDMSWYAWTLIFIYLFIWMMKRHMNTVTCDIIWQLCHRPRTLKNRLEEVMSKHISTACHSHGIFMANTWTLEWGYLLWHKLCIYCINRVAMHWRLLVKFSCDFHEILHVVATTRHSRTNDLTSSKALSRAIK